MWFSETTPREPPAAQPGRAQPGERRGLRARLRRGQPARQRLAAALLQRAGRRHRHPAQSRRCELPLVPSHLRVRPALPVRPRGRRGPLDPVRARHDTCPASTTWPATACCPGARWPSCAASAPSPHAAGRRRAWPPGRCGRLGVRLPPELLDLLRYGRGVDNRRLKRGRVPLPVHLGRRGQGVRRGATGCARPSASTTPAYRYERDVEQFFRHSPAVVRDGS